MRWTIWGVLVWAWAGVGCSAHTLLTAAEQRAVQARHVGKVYELRHSCFYGDLYADNERWLLSTLPFEQTYHLVDLRGRPITAKNQRGLLPAGTPLQVVALQFPTPLRVASRMVTTPRFNTWVVLRPLPTTAGLGPNSRDLIVVLPDELGDDAAAEAALTAELAPQPEISRWLEQVRPTVRVAIEHKEVLVGMNLQEVLASQGEPLHWLVDQLTDGTACRVAWYPQAEVWLCHGAVHAVRSARPAE